MTRVAAYVPDLMDQSRVAAVPGLDVTFVRSPAELLEAGADVVLVDLARPGVLEAVSALGAIRTIGFASHVDHALIESARAAGCGEVLPRSRFFSSLAALLKPPH